MEGGRKKNSFEFWSFSSPHLPQIVQAERIYFQGNNNYLSLIKILKAKPKLIVIFKN